jgi:hypothetical protein
VSYIDGAFCEKHKCHDYCTELAGLREELKVTGSMLDGALAETLKVQKERDVADELLGQWITAHDVLQHALGDDGGWTDTQNALDTLRPVLRRVRQRLGLAPKREENDCTCRMEGKELNESQCERHGQTPSYTFKVKIEE